MYWYCQSRRQTISKEKMMLTTRISEYELIDSSWRLENEDGYILAVYSWFEGGKALHLGIFASNFPELDRKAKENPNEDYSLEYVKKEIELLMGCYSRENIQNSPARAWIRCYFKAINADVCGVPIMVTKLDKTEEDLERILKEWKRLRDIS